MSNSILLGVILFLLGALALFFNSLTKEIAKNIATRKDVEKITEKIEKTKTLYIQQNALIERRREVYQRMANSLRIFISGHSTAETDREEFLAAYSSCWLWAPDEIITLLNDFLLLIKDISSKKINNPQSVLKESYNKIILEMRRDVGFANTALS